MTEVPVKTSAVVAKWVAGVVAGCIISTWPFLIGVSGWAIQKLIELDRRTSFIEGTRFTADMARREHDALSTRISVVEIDGARVDQRLSNMEGLLQDIKDSLSKKGYTNNGN